MIETLIGLAIMGITQLSKSYIMPKYGANGVHIFVALLAIIATVVQYVATQNPNFLALLTQAGTLLVAVVGTYEVIFSKIGNSINVVGSI